MQTILTALSGGVDSAVTAGLLLRQGCRVGGATMLLRPGGESEAEDAAAAARRLGIPFHLFAWQEAFAQAVIAPFAEVYRAGGTPNPCVFCNRALKFGRFLDAALALGYDGIATGHYARVDYDAASGRYLLRTARDAAKDQTYMLARLDQRQLGHTVLPLGAYTKAQVRQLAGELGLVEQAAKGDSQDICFVPDGDYLGFLRRWGLTPQPGRFRDEAGRDLGPHRGYEGYTVGQRRGLGLSAGSRLYVVAKPRPDVVVGGPEALYTRDAVAAEMNWIPWETPPREFRAEARLRYTAKPAPCAVRVEGDRAFLRFDEPQRAVTPGQTAVLYDGELVLGGGVLVESAKERR